MLAIERCQPIASGQGRVVLTTINHLNRDVLELTLEDAGGNRQTLRPTGLHKFYSVTRRAWLSAQELHRGEQIEGVNGPVTLAGKEDEIRGRSSFLLNRCRKELRPLSFPSARAPTSINPTAAPKDVRTQLMAWCIARGDSEPS